MALQKEYKVDRQMPPWTDYNGATLYEHDFIWHPSGEIGVIFCVDADNAHDRWRVRYSNGVVSRLSLQVGDKGQAVKANFDGTTKGILGNHGEPKYVCGDYSPEEMEKRNLELLLAALLLNRHEPMAPHHRSAIRELLGDKTDDELLEFIRKGKWE